MFKSTGTNAKVRAVLNLAIERKEIKVKFDSTEEARQFRSLCYSIRHSDRKKKKNNGVSKYDELSIALDGASLMIVSAASLLSELDITCPKTGEPVLSQEVAEEFDEDDGFIEEAIKELKQ